MPLVTMSDLSYSKDRINQLQMDILGLHSRFYKNPDPIVANMTQNVNVEMTLFSD